MAEEEKRSILFYGLALRIPNYAMESDAMPAWLSRSLADAAQRER